MSRAVPRLSRAAVVVLALAGGCSDGGGSEPPDARPPVDAAVDAVPSARVTVTRAGAGTVTSVPGGIACGATCSAAFAVGSQVRLVASAPMGVTFTGWSGACAGTGDCDLTIAGDVAVTATFTGEPCTDDCAAGQTECVTGTSDRACGQFDTDTCLEWSPATACTGVEECRLGRCGGAHKLAVLPLPELMTPDGVGTVSSAPAGITCGRAGNDCQEYYPDGTSVTLTATSDATAVFYGWTLVPLGGDNGAACVGSTQPCTVSITEPTTLGAAYCTPECAAGTARCTGLTVAETCGEHDDDPCRDLGAPTTCPVNTLCTASGCAAGFAVTATTAGEGSGRVAIDGVACAQVPCSRGVATGGSATITATPTPYSVFTGWSGACTGTGPCVVSAAGTATANFAYRCADDDLTFTFGSLYDLGLGLQSIYYLRFYDFTSAAWRMNQVGDGRAQLSPASLSYLLVDEPYVYWGGVAGADYTVVRFTAGAPEVVVNDAGDGTPGLNATHVFYRRAATLRRAPKAGGASMELAANLPVTGGEPIEVLADATRAYWFGGGTVLSIPVGGGAPTMLAMGQGLITDAIQDATHVYWLRGGDIVRVGKAGGAVETLVAGAGATNIAVRGATLVWTGTFPDNRAYTTRIGSGVVEQLSYLETESGPRRVALDANRVYVVGSHPGGDFIIRFPRTATCAPP